MTPILSGLSPATGPAAGETLVTVSGLTSTPHRLPLRLWVDRRRAVAVTIGS